MAKQPDLLAQFTARMQNLESRAEFSGRFVIFLRSELAYLSQSNCRQKQQKEPCRAAEVPAGVRPEKPGDSCNRQHNEGSERPPVVGRAGPPRAYQNQQRRNDRQEKEDVIEIQSAS